jgi:ABC-type transport system involved in cytochrome bd biosynthesis fused ATPase/permease subunit
VTSVIICGPVIHVIIWVVLAAQAIFDEVTSSLDEEGEQALYAAICDCCPAFISIGTRDLVLSILLY